MTLGTGIGILRVSACSGRSRSRRRFAAHSGPGLRPSPCRQARWVGRGLQGQRRAAGEVADWSRTDQTQKTTPDGRPIWAVRLIPIDADSNSSETVWVEVARDEPKLTLDELALVQGLAFAPWVNKKGEIVRNFRADSVTVLADARRTQAA